MKKLFAPLAFAAILAAGLASCTKVECDCNHDGSEWSVQKVVKDYVIQSSDWEYITDSDGYNGCFRAILNCSELTQTILDEGVCLAYLVNSDGTQAVLPSVRHMEEVYTENGEATYYFWTQTIDAEFAVGTVYVYLTESDFYSTADNPPAGISVKVTLVW